jgi:hypothetical protein
MPMPAPIILDLTGRARLSPEQAADSGCLGRRRYRT